MNGRPDPMMWSTETPVSGSRPVTVATSSSPSDRTTEMLVAPAITAEGTTT